MNVVLGREHPFWGAREKVDRAGQHLKSLHSEFAEWCDRYPHGLVAIPELKEVNPDTGEWIASFTFNVNPPTWGVVIGEFLHDLRSALNHLLVMVAEPPTDSTQFPCAATTGDYKSCRPMLADVPAPYLAVVESVQPYHRGDKAAALLDPLRRLADLNNRDKHHLLLVTLLGLPDATGTFKSVWEHPGVESVQFTVGPSEEQTQFLGLRFREGEESNVDMNDQPSVGVVFNEPELPSVNRMLVEPILGEMLSVSRGIVEDFFRIAT